MKPTFRDRIKATWRAWSAQKVDDWDRYLDTLVGGVPARSGVTVNAETALNFSAFFNGVQQISQTVASLPLILYKRVGEGNKERLRAHPLYGILHRKVNPRMPAFIWKEVTQYHLLVWGNAYSFIRWEDDNRVKELWPMNPERTWPEVVNGNLVYKFRNEQNREVIYPAEVILHIPGLGFDGIKGYSLLSLARESIGLGLGYDEFAARFVGQGTHSGGVATHPGKLSPEAYDRLKKSLSDSYAGLNKVGKIMVFEEGMTYQNLGMPLKDAEFLSSRTFQINEIARWLNMPPHKLKELSHATYDNITSEQISWLQDTIRPWLERWESYIDFKLLNDEEQKTAFAEFLPESILRTDIKTRYEAYHIARMDGIISANEWRALENMNPLDDEVGDKIWMPLNMVDARKSDEMFTQRSQPVQEEEEENSTREQRTMGIAEIRSIAGRRRVADSYRERFKEATRKILKRERTAIMRIAKKTLQERALKDFGNQIDEFYEKNRDVIRAAFAGVYQSYAADIYPIALEEVNGKGEPDEEFRRYVDQYSDNTSTRYINSSRGQIKGIARDSEQPIEDIEQRLNDWEEKRPEKIASREVVDGETGIAQYVYFAAGFKTRWVTIGDSCPYCNAMNGRVIGRAGAFLMAGDSFEPEGAVNGPLQISRDTRHPQLHQGCDCTVSAALL